MEFTTQTFDSPQNENPFGMNLEFWNFLNEKEEDNKDTSLTQEPESENLKQSAVENL